MNILYHRVSIGWNRSSCLSFGDGTPIQPFPIEGKGSEKPCAIKELVTTTLRLELAMFDLCGSWRLITFDYRELSSTHNPKRYAPRTTGNAVAPRSFAVVGL